MQLTEPMKAVASSAAPTPIRVLVVDTDTSTYVDLLDELDGEFVLHFSQELEEAEALISTLLYSAVVVRACAVGSDRRQHLDFVRFVGLHSHRTRVIVLDQPARFGDDDGALAMSVALVLPRQPRPQMLAMVVSQIARSS